MLDGCCGVGSIPRQSRLDLRGSEGRTRSRESREEPVYRLRPDFFRSNFAICRHGAIAMWPARFTAFTRNIHWLSSFTAASVTTTKRFGFLGHPTLVPVRPRSRLRSRCYHSGAISRLASHRPGSMGSQEVSPRMPCEADIGDPYHWAVAQGAKPQP